MVIVKHTPEVSLVYTNASQIRGLINKIFEDLYGVRVENGLREVLKRRHASVPEIIVFLFRIEASRACTHEIVRHRIATYWQESQRYSKQRPTFIVPRTLRNVLGTWVEELLANIYTVYEEAVDTKKLRKELARYILPNACASKIYCLWNLRELCESVIPLRICRRALPEFRYIAYRLLTIVTEHIPEVIETKYTGPRCIIYGRCPEDGKPLDKCTECFATGLREAILEHGTDEEITNIDKIVEEWTRKLFD